MQSDAGIVCFATLFGAAALVGGAFAYDVPRLAVGTIDALDGDVVAVSNAAMFRAGASFAGDVSFGGGVRILPASGLPMGAFTNVGAVAARPGPTWWAARGVLDPLAEADDFAVVAQGQVKWLADRAAAGFAEAGALAGGSGVRAKALVASFTPSNNVLPALLGQVRAAAEPFWRRLDELGVAAPPAWLEMSGADSALANVGQAKAAFAFDLPPVPNPSADADGDGMPNGWEIAHGLDPYDAADAAGDADGDGLSNLDEVQFGTDPRIGDTDGDGLTDAEEGGTVVVERTFMWFDISDAENLLVGWTDVDADTWKLPLADPIVINDVNYTNVCVCLGGTVHLLCPTNTDGWLSGYSTYGGLGEVQWSRAHITVALCAADLYARAEDWGSRVCLGQVESGGRAFTVVEYRDVGLYVERDTDARAVFQLILPHDETNVVYVSYLRVSDEIRSADPVAGIQCGWMQSFKGWDQFYNVSWPSALPPNGTTIRYVIGTGTDPCAVDTDGDGLSDFEEVRNRYTNPLSTDTDGDGLSNFAEYGMGTDPSEPDTDDDGLSDWEEIGWWEHVGALPVFDVSAGTNLLLSSQSYDGSSFVVPLPFVVHCAGRIHTNLTVCLDGVVALMSAGDASSFYVSPLNDDFRTFWLNDQHTTVAAYWDNLYAPAHGGAQIRVADVETNGLRYAVIEYADIQLYSQRNAAVQTATFQIVIPQMETNTVYVHYIDLSPVFDGASATLGAQLPNRMRTFAVAYNEAGSVTNGMVVAYHFGTGSDPCFADTDGDGLSDTDEIARGMNPRDVDTDGDGLPDGWEVQHGLDPLSTTGNDGANGDFDGDFLLNAKEFEYGTDPSASDTDGDTLLDGMETGSVFTTNAIPWLSFDAYEDLTTIIFTNRECCVKRPLPVPLRIQGEYVTNVTISANGVLFFDRAEYANPGNFITDANFRCEIYRNALVLAPYLQRAYARSDLVDIRTSIRYGTATHDGVGYLLLEYLNSCYDTLSWRTNAISFQLAMPTNSPDRAYSRYRDVMGQYMDGRCASIGMQTFDAKWLHAWCYRTEGRVEEGLALEFLFGANVDPFVVDTDEDGLTDMAEVGVLMVEPHNLAFGWGSFGVLEDYTQLFVEAEGRSIRLNLPTPAYFPGGRRYSGIEIDPRGFIRFNPTNTVTGIGGVHASFDLETMSIDRDEFVVAAYWAPLVLSTNEPASCIARVQWASDSCIEFTNMRLEGYPDDVRVSFLIAPPTERAPCVGLWYQIYGDGADGEAAVIGSKGLEGRFLSVFCDHAAGGLEDGMMLYAFPPLGTDPCAADTDGDGVPDCIEVERGADPANPSDNGLAPPAERFRTLTFNIYGDWAAWEMLIEGLGPEDTRVRRISMAAPADSEYETMKMRKGNSYRLSMRWLNCGDHHDKNAPWYCWQAQIDDKPGECTYESYTSTRKSGVAETIIGNGWVAENTGGLLTSHVHENAKKGGNVAGNLTATLHVLDDPKIIPDYDRDGKIDSSDEAIYDAGRTTFRFWVNNDDDRADTNNGEKDRPGAGVNWMDNRVNGRCDLLDFTPVLIDVSGVFPSGTPDEIKDRVTWRLESSVVNAVWTSLDAENAGAFQKMDCGTAFGPDLSQNVQKATVTHLSDGDELPHKFMEWLQESGGRGVVLIEGCKAGSTMRLRGTIDDSETLTMEGCLNIQISSVEHMFRSVSLRGVEKGSHFTVTIPSALFPQMDGVKELDVFFTHGFNVSESEAHAWGAEVFKRLWQSGSNARFWSATWSGDYNWLWNTFNGLHYQQDVYHALKTGAAFRAFVEGAQPDSSKRILMAHSLGNMVACEALRQGLAVNKYFMFNAAVASEAVDGTLQNANATTRAKYVPSDWSDYDSRSWAANWYRWFKDDTSDARGNMGWPDYFLSALSRAGTVYNYYSTGDPIFFESDTVPNVATGLFHWPTLSWSWPFVDFNITAEEGCWQKQETHKGIEPIAGTLLGGWGFYCWDEGVGGESVQRYYTTAQANAMVADGSITNSPVFSYGGTPMNNRNASWDDIWLSLAKYVPAISSPIGGMAALGSEDHNLNGASYRDGWGRQDNVYNQNWLHSDMKDMAFFYVYPLYNELVQKGMMK